VTSRNKKKLEREKAQREQIPEPTPQYSRIEIRARSAEVDSKIYNSRPQDESQKRHRRNKCPGLPSSLK
jgi:hypothetical protein